MLERKTKKVFVPTHNAASADRQPRNKGQNPLDEGDEYMEKVNIKQKMKANIYNIRQLKGKSLVFV